MPLVPLTDHELKTPLLRNQSIVRVVNVTDIHLAQYNNTVEDIWRVGKLVMVGGVSRDEKKLISELQRLGIQWYY
jgi:hypothetical protein